MSYYVFNFTPDGRAYSIRAGEDFRYGSYETEIPDRLEKTPIVKVEENGFTDKTEIYTLRLGKHIKEIGDGAFKGCSKLNELFLPKALGRIGNFAFSNTSLYSVSIPAKVSVIESYAFYGSTLKELKISHSLRKLGINAFGHCSLLDTVSVSIFNKHFKSSDNVLYSKNGKLLILYCPGKSGKTFTVPPSVAELAPFSFSYAGNLESVRISEGVKSIGDNAFLGCTSLETVFIPASVEMIGKNAFDGCSKLRVITVDEKNEHFKAVDNVIYSKEGLHKKTVL